VLDFSVNTNVYGPCPRVVDAIRAAVLDRYPDPTGRDARQRLSQFLGVDPERVVLGNGAADLLWTLARFLSRTASKALIVEPTFCEFRAACVASGLETVEWRACEATGFAVDLPGVSSRVRSENARVVYLCSPNTPTGVSLPAEAIAGWAAEHSDVFVVLDQSFLSLSERADEASVPMPKNVVCVRSLTKDHAIPGVRAGYAVAPAGVARELLRQQPAWPVSTLTEAAVIAACRSSAFVEDSCRRLLEDRDRLQDLVRAEAVSTLPSSTVFFLVRVGSATDLRERMLARHRIAVRDCTSFGLPNFIRVAARPEADARRLVRALRVELFDAADEHKRRTPRTESGAF
jgi:histidinol-phosphate/aromatic aminotransferase/cobyric acid decarboxylase-like protein